MEVTCPNCKEKYDLGNEFGGEKVQCWKCSYKFFVPYQNKNNSNLIECSDCGRSISRAARVCPHCGKRIMSRFRKICYYVLLYLAANFFLASLVSWAIFPRYAINFVLWAIFCIIAAKR